MSLSRTLRVLLSLLLGMNISYALGNTTSGNNCSYGDPRPSHHACFIPFVIPLSNNSLPPIDPYSIHSKTNLFCEYQVFKHMRLDGASAGLAEPINTFSNVGFVIAGLLLLRSHRSSVVWVQSSSLILLGIGSAVYHATGRLGELDGIPMFFIIDLHIYILLQGLIGRVDRRSLIRLFVPLFVGALAIFQLLMHIADDSPFDFQTLIIISSALLVAVLTAAVALYGGLSSCCFLSTFRRLQPKQAFASPNGSASTLRYLYALGMVSLLLGILCKGIEKYIPCGWMQLHLNPHHYWHMHMSVALYCTSLCGMIMQEIIDTPTELDPQCVTNVTVHFHSLWDEFKSYFDWIHPNWTIRKFLIHPLDLLLGINAGHGLFPTLTSETIHEIQQPAGEDNYSNVQGCVQSVAIPENPLPLEDISTVWSRSAMSVWFFMDLSLLLFITVAGRWNAIDAIAIAIRMSPWIVTQLFVSPHVSNWSFSIVCTLRAFDIGLPIVLGTDQLQVYKWLESIDSLPDSPLPTLFILLTVPSFIAAMYFLPPVWAPKTVIDEYWRHNRVPQLEEPHVMKRYLNTLLLPYYPELKCQIRNSKSLFGVESNCNILPQAQRSLWFIIFISVSGLTVTSRNDSSWLQLVPPFMALVSGIVVVTFSAPERTRQGRNNFHQTNPAKAQKLMCLIAGSIFICLGAYLYSLWVSVSVDHQAIRQRMLVSMYSQMHIFAIVAVFLMPPVFRQPQRMGDNDNPRQKFDARVKYYVSYASVIFWIGCGHHLLTVVLGVLTEFGHRLADHLILPICLFQFHVFIQMQLHMVVARLKMKNENNHSECVEDNVCLR